MFCIYCNKPLTGDEKVCPSCGRALGDFVLIDVFRGGTGVRAAADSIEGLRLPAPELSGERPRTDESTAAGGSSKEGETEAGGSSKEERTAVSGLSGSSRTNENIGKYDIEGDHHMKTKGNLPAVLLSFASLLLILATALVLNSRIQKLQDEHLAEIQSMESRIQEQENMAETLKGQNESLSALVDELNGQMDAQSSLIGSLEEEVGVLREENQNFRERLEEMDKEKEKPGDESDKASDQENKKQRDSSEESADEAKETGNKDEESGDDAKPADDGEEAENK